MTLADVELTIVALGGVMRAVTADRPRTVDDEVAVYCPDCAEREFDRDDKREGRSDRGSA